MTIKDWSLVPATNATVSDGTYGNISWAEGMNPNLVNDSARATMAHVREFYETLEWRDLGHTPVYSDADTFTVASASDLSDVYTVGRRFRATDASTLYGVITASSYAASTQTVDVKLDSGSLSASLTNIALGFDITNFPYLTSAQGTADSANGQTFSDFTGIPSWATEITVNILGLTTNGTAIPKIQIGDAGGIETTTPTPYVGSVMTMVVSTITAANLSAGFQLAVAWADDSVATGSYRLTNITGNTWICEGGIGFSNSAATATTRGYKTLSGVLDRVRVIMDGTDEFDGSTYINISYRR